VGRFDRETTVEIRSSLTLEDTPPGIPGETYPTQEDQELVLVDYPISGGDVLNVEIHELRDRQIPYQAQVQVSATGYVNIPVVGRIKAADLTVPEFELALASALKEKDVLRTPEVTVNAQFLQRGAYSVFGIGVSAADNAPLRAGTFPIRRPDLRLLEAINLVGGLNELVTDVYVFRYESPPASPHGQALPHPNGLPPAESPPADPPVGELLEAARPAAQRRMDTEAQDQREPAEERFAPDPPQPFLWVNDEWIPNPAYKKRLREGGSPTGTAGLDTAAPAVNWARIAGDSSYRVIRVPAESLRTGDPEVNIYVRAGDVIRVVSGEIGIYYVMGQVNRVGPFAFNAEPVTLKAAIVVAGGLSGLAWPDRCTVYRRLGQREQMIQVNLDRIFAGKDADFLIKRGDIINVGTHPFAPFLQRIRAWTLPNPVNNVGYSFTYSRNFADIDSFSVRQNPHNEPERFPALFP